MSTKSKTPGTNFQTIRQLWKALEQKLKQSKLTLQDAKVLQIKPFTAKQVAIHFKTLPVFRAGFQLPYFGISGKRTKFYRFRYLEYTDSTGFGAVATQNVKELRYGQPKDSLNELYFPPFIDWKDLAADPARPLLVGEGEVKAACGTKHGLPTIGLGGVWCFKSNRERLPLLEQFKQIIWKERDVYICYDSDASTNPQVAKATNALARELVQLGARPYITHLPSIDPPNKTGLDDYIATLGVKDFKETVLEMATEWKAAEELFKLNEEVVYVKDPGLILRLDNLQRMTPRAFVEHAYAPRIYYEERETQNGTKLIEHSAAKEWLKWQQRATVRRTTYAPGQPRITTAGELNLWPGWAIEPEKGDVAPWHDFLDYLFEGCPPEHRKWFEQWLAYPLQHPGTKLYSAVVMWSRLHGTGKSTVGYIMRRIYGSNFTEIQDHHIFSNHNEWAENRQFVMADEITGGGSNKKHIADRLKSMITQKELRLNPKYVPSYAVPDCINYFFTSNHADAFFLEDDDRRFFIHEVTQPPLQPEDFRNRYLNWLEAGQGRGTRALFHYLLTLDLTDFDPQGRAPETAAKREMTENVRGELAAWCHQLLEDPARTLVIGDVSLPRTVFTTAELLSIYDATGATGTSKTQMGRALRNAGLNKVPNNDPDTKIRGLCDWQGKSMPKAAVWAVSGGDRKELRSVAGVRKLYNRECAAQSAIKQAKSKMSGGHHAKR